MDKYIGKTYQLTSASITGSEINGGRPILMKRGDRFVVVAQKGANYVCDYLGVSDTQNIGEQFSAHRSFLDEDCEVVGSAPDRPKSDSDCHCSSQDLAGIGHQPNCAFMAAGGCGNKPLRW